MRKLLSFTFAILLLFALTGCNAFLDHFQKSARTTITEDEWLTALDCCNYTISGSATYSNADGQKLETDTIYAKVTGTSFYRLQTTGVGINKTEKKDYYIMIDNVNYHLAQTSSGYVANQVSVGYADEKFGEVFDATVDQNAIFSCLTYNAEAKNYTGTYTTDDETVYTIAATFVDGKITSADILLKSGTLEIQYTFYSFGTTVIDLPEYTIAPQ